jgi:thiamine biosynthesis lipoprotein
MKKSYVTAYRAMGCQINVWLETDDDGAEILRQVPEWTENIEAHLSRFRQDSELSQLNAKLGQWVEVSDLLLANIITAKQGARRTDGLYNPLVLNALLYAGYDRSFEQLQVSTQKVRPIHVPDWQNIAINPVKGTVCIPAPIDLGGIAKGWCANYIADQLAAYGSCVVDIGGDIVVHDPDSELGREIAVDYPGDNSIPLLKVTLKTGSIVTSGRDYRRWFKGGEPQHHLINPRTGLPAQTDVISATVIHPHAPTAEAYAKAILLLGSQAGLEWINQQWEHAALVVRNDGAVLATDSFQKFILEGAIA